MFIRNSFIMCPLYYTHIIILTDLYILKLQKKNQFENGTLQSKYAIMQPASNSMVVFVICIQFYRYKINTQIINVFVFCLLYIFLI